MVDRSQLVSTSKVDQGKATETPPDTVYKTEQEKRVTRKEDGQGQAVTRAIDAVED